jgi:two-component system NtrC family sensor kinase
MSKPRFSLRRKLMASSLVMLLLSGLLSLLAGSRLIRDALLSQAQEKVRHDLASAWMVFDGKIENIKNVVRLTAARESLRDHLKDRRLDVLSRYLRRVRVDDGLDVLTLVGADGRVLLRTVDAAPAGDDQSADPVVRRALGRRTVAAAQLVSRDELLREGGDLAARAAMDFIPTPLSAPHTIDRETSGMMLRAAAPILDEDETLLGVLYGGVLLNRTTEIVDRIKGAVFKDERYKGRETGTATIFQNDLRISTNVKDERGERAVGTLLSAEVKRAVLDEGRPWIARAFVVNDWYITAYEPIRDVDTRIIGILYVGTLERPYLDTSGRVSLTFTLISSLGILLLLAVLYLLTTRLVRPLRDMAEATRVIAQGDLSRKVEAGTRDEVGALADSFNEMTDHLREANAKLLEWGTTLERKVEERTRQLRDIQEHLIQSEKLASIGKLAAGIAHEINNPLGGILIYSHLILEDTPPGRPHHDNLRKIVKETTRCKEIVKGLLDFARPKEPDTAPVDVPAVLDSCLAFAGHQTLFQNIKVERSYAPDLPKVVADAAQLQQVFMNLILNAAESMDGRGTLSLRVRTDSGRREIVIDVADTGRGIKPEDRARLFEPFFTTKEVGKGTGLGLAISYGIVRKHQGSIDVASEPGRGAVFTVRLPLPEKTP